MKKDFQICSYSLAWDDETRIVLGRSSSDGTARLENRDASSAPNPPGGHLVRVLVLVLRTYRLTGIFPTGARRELERGLALQALDSSWH
jgi:hypothetical protein